MAVPLFTVLEPINGESRAHEHPALKLTDAERAAGVTPVNYAYPPGHFFRWLTDVQRNDVLSRGQTQNVTQALINAISSIGTDGVKIPAVTGATTYTGGELYFPSGTYLISFGQITVTTIGLILQGAGAQLFNDYKVAATIIVVDGTGSLGPGDPGGPSFVFQATTHENARGLVCRDIAFQYKNSYAGDYFYWGAAGVSFDHCSFSSSSISGGVRPMTCNSFLRMFNGHHYSVDVCSFSDAKNALIIDNATAANTNGWSIRKCAFYDFSDSFITVTGSGASGLDIAACDFDPINTDQDTNPMTNGCVLIGVGFHIHGCHFAGSDNTSCPINSWLSVEGDGAIDGNAFIFQLEAPAATKAAILVTGGNVRVSSNRISCSSGLIASGAACLTGAGNYYNNLTADASDIAVRLSQDSTSYTSIGPDTVSAGFANSYRLDGSSATTGEVHYSPSVDGSTGGPLFANGSGYFHLRSTNLQLDISTTGTLTIKQTGQTFGPSGTPTFTLPASTVAGGGLRYTFLKNAVGTFTINMGSGVTIYKGASTGSSIANSTTEVGAAITLRYLDNTKVIIDGMNGTWA